MACITPSPPTATRPGDQHAGAERGGLCRAHDGDIVARHHLHHTDAQAAERRVDTFRRTLGPVEPEANPPTWVVDRTGLSVNISYFGRLDELEAAEQLEKDSGMPVFLGAGCGPGSVTVRALGLYRAYDYVIRTLSMAGMSPVGAPRSRTISVPRPRCRRRIRPFASVRLTGGMR
ncbi:MAG: hypothetical protein U5K37_06270 [Natrialbaceae archaeon]|nr:hypothetical protein [Natrialbaceae archaeon]